MTEVKDRDALIWCQAVTRRFQTGHDTVEALPPTDLSISPGSTGAIIGPSGSGKSTLLSLMGGLDRPSDGEVVFLGKPYSKLSQPQLITHRRKHIGFVFQTANLVKGMTVKDNISLPLWLNGWTDNEVGERVQELCERLGIGHLHTRRPNQLSTGEKQRVALAWAVAHRPRLVLADEPTGNLDYRNADQVFELLLSLVEENQCAVVVATHDLRLADQMQQVVSLERKGGQDDY